MRVEILVKGDSENIKEYMESWPGHLGIQIERKIREQLERKPALCTHPESSDTLYDRMGRNIGIVDVRED